MKERTGIKTKKFLIVVAAIGNSYYNDAMSSLKPNFIRQLSIFLDGPKIKDLKRRKIMQSYHEKLKNYKNKGLVKKEKEIFVLTDKAWDKLGITIKVLLEHLFPKEINSHSGNIERFDIKEYSEIKREKAKNNFIINYVDNQKGIIKNQLLQQQLSVESHEAYKNFEDKIRRLFFLLN